MHRNFRLLFIPANSGYNTYRKNIQISLKTCHDKTGYLKMLVESLYVYIVGIKYKSHNNQCPIFQDTRYKFIFYFFDLNSHTIFP
jgi:hypothetical protein